MSDQQSADSDALEVAMIADLEPEAMNKAAAIVADNRFSAEYKAEQVQTIVSQAADLMTQRGNDTIDRLTKRLVEQSKAARLSVAPAPEKAAQLVYVRDALESQWGSMTVPQMYAAWTAALDANDLITARVYFDYTLPFIRRKLDIPPTLPFTARNGDIDLTEKTEEALLSAEQKQARIAIKKTSETLRHVRMATGRAESLKATRVRNGELVEGWAGRKVRPNVFGAGQG